MGSHARVTCLSNDPMVIFIWRLCVNFNEIPHDFSMIEPSCKWDTSQFYKGYEQLTSWETFLEVPLWHLLLKGPLASRKLVQIWVKLWPLHGTSTWGKNGQFVGWFHLKVYGVPAVETFSRSETQVLRRRRALQGRGRSGSWCVQISGIMSWQRVNDHGWSMR